MHLLVIGATGPSGIAFLEEAVKASHRVTVFARNPSKLPEHLTKNPQIEMIKGTFDDTNAINEAIQCGATILVSFAGPTVQSKGTPVTDFYSILFPLIQKSKTATIKRCLCCTTPSFKISEDKPSWKWWFLVLSIWLVGGSAYDEVNGIGRVVSALPLTEMEWTLFRVPVLTNGEAKSVRAGLIGEGQDGTVLSRKSIAVWIVHEIEARKWIGKAPALCNPGWV